MTIGTKSVLYGAHCFFIHPFFVALAWFRLYGFRRVEDPFVGKVSILHPLLWVAFFLHDAGYLGKPNMDGPEGEMHPEFAGRILRRLGGKDWERFTVFHSRYLAKQSGAPYSLLCPADKLAVALEPFWLYLPRVIATGEIKEYMRLAGAKNPDSKYAGEPPTKYESAGYDLSTRKSWCLNMQEYCRSWAHEHKDGRQDTWTPSVKGARVAIDETGVYK